MMSPLEHSTKLDQTRIEGLADGLEKAITRIAPYLFAYAPVEAYIDHLASTPKCASYRYINEWILDKCNTMVSVGGSGLLGAYHRLLLLRLIQRGPERLARSRYGCDVRNRFIRNFSRITSTIECDLEGANYTHSVDRFSKQLAICDLRLIPMGPVKIHLDKLPLLKSIDARPLLSRATNILGDRGPFYHMHVDSHDPEAMAEFNSYGWQDCYRRVAALLQDRNDVEGVFGTSWFFDPQLETISPRLAYLRSIPTRSGASIFRIGESKYSTADATAKSETRRRLVAEGKYLPLEFLLVWPRAALIEWAFHNA